MGKTTQGGVQRHQAGDDLMLFPRVYGLVKQLWKPPPVRDSTKTKGLCHFCPHQVWAGGSNKGVVGGKRPEPSPLRRNKRSLKHTLRGKREQGKKQRRGNTQRLAKAPSVQATTSPPRQGEGCLPLALQRPAKGEGSGSTTGLLY